MKCPILDSWLDVRCPHHCTSSKASLRFQNPVSTIWDPAAASTLSHRPRNCHHQRPSLCQCGETGASCRHHSQGRWNPKPMTCQAGKARQHIGRPNGANSVELQAALPLCIALAIPWLCFPESRALGNNIQAERSKYARKQNRVWEKVA